MGQFDPPPQQSGKRTPRTGVPSGRVGILPRSGAGHRITRLFHRWGERPVEAAADSLRQALLLMGDSHDGNLLVAGAGFAWVRMSDPTAARLPNEDEFAAVADLARQAAETVRSSLPPNRPLIVFGVDVYAACLRSEAERQVGQFAAVLEHGGNLTLLPKQFPTPEEDAYLRPVGSSAPDPACDTPLGRAVVLVCHDVNAYSPRGEATTTYQGRADRRTTLRQRVQSLVPALGLHLAHYVETAASFRQAYGAWGAEVNVPLVGVSGLPADVTPDDGASLAASLLGGTVGWPVLDLLEHPVE